MYKILQTLQKTQQVVKLKQSSDFSSGFDYAMFTIQKELKDNPSINLHIENKELRKKITELEIELDFITGEYETYKKLQNLKVEVDILGELKGLKFTKITVKEFEVIFVTTASRKIVEESVFPVLERVMKKYGENQTSLNYIQNTFINYLNSKGYKTKKIENSKRKFN